MPTRAPATARARTAATATAADGSINCFVNCQTICIASTIATSSTVTMSFTCSRTIAKVRVGEAGEQTVGDRGRGQGRLAHPGREGPGRVIGERGLGAEHDRVGPEAAGRQRRARQESAAAHRRDDEIQVVDLLDELERGGAGSGDHRVVVERVDLRRARAGHHLRERLGTRFRRVLTCRDDPAVREHRGALHRAHRLGHHHMRGDAAGLRSERERGSVIARRVRGHAVARLAIAQRLHGVRRAAVLEGAGALQVLRLEEGGCAEPLVQRGTCEHRCVVYERRDARRGGAHVVVCGRH